MQSKWFTVVNDSLVLHHPGKMIKFPDGRKQPFHVTELWSPAVKAEWGLHEGVPATIPPGQRAVTRAWAWTGTAVEEVVTTEPLPAPPTRQKRFDQRIDNLDVVTEAIIAGMAELKGLPIPATKAWLKGLL